MGQKVQADVASFAQGYELATLPRGHILDLRRPRSEGPLDAEALAYCRAEGIPLAYDPAQIGWVTAACEDDISLGWYAAPAPARAASEDRWVSVAQLAERYQFRPWRESEISIFVSLLDNSKVWEHLPETYPAPLTDGMAQALIEVSNHADHHQVLAVELHGEVVGQVRLAFSPVDGNRSEGEISYWLGERFWGRGIGSDLVLLFTSRSFQQRPDLLSIVARVHENNAASARVLEKCGYHYIEHKSEDQTWRVYRAFRTDY